MKVQNRASVIGIDYPAALSVIALYPAPAGYAFALILFFGRGRGRGGRAIFFQLLIRIENIRELTGLTLRNDI